MGEENKFNSENVKGIVVISIFVVILIIGIRYSSKLIYGGGNNDNSAKKFKGMYTLTDDTLTTRHNYILDENGFYDFMYKVKDVVGKYPDDSNVEIINDSECIIRFDTGEYKIYFESNEEYAYGNVFKDSLCVMEWHPYVEYLTTKYYKEDYFHVMYDIRSNYDVQGKFNWLDSNQSAFNLEESAIACDILEEYLGDKIKDGFVAYDGSDYSYISDTGETCLLLRNTESDEQYIIDISGRRARLFKVL